MGLAGEQRVSQLLGSSAYRRGVADKKERNVSACALIYMFRFSLVLFFVCVISRFWLILVRFHRPVRVQGAVLLFLSPGVDVSNRNGLFDQSDVALDVGPLEEKRKAESFCSSFLSATVVTLTPATWQFATLLWYNIPFRPLKSRC